MAKRVGIVGIGIMGTAMMRNLVKDGFEVVGYDIAEQAMARLAEAGGITAASPRDVAASSPVSPGGVATSPALQYHDRTHAQAGRAALRNSTSGQRDRSIGEPDQSECRGRHQIHATSDAREGNAALCLEGCDRK
jgi:UDP-N-acetylmuramoylalanine-D-glutamate ligase